MTEDTLPPIEYKVRVTVTIREKDNGDEGLARSVALTHLSNRVLDDPYLPAELLHRAAELLEDRREDELARQVTLGKYLVAPGALTPKTTRGAEPNE